MTDVTENKLHLGDCIVVAMGGNLEMAVYLGKGSWYDEETKEHVDIDTIMEFLTLYEGHSASIKKYGMYPTRIHSARSTRVANINPKVLNKLLYKEYIKLNKFLKNGYTRDRNK